MNLKLSSQDEFDESPIIIVPEDAILPEDDGGDEKEAVAAELTARDGRRDSSDDTEASLSPEPAVHRVRTPRALFLRRCLYAAASCAAVVVVTIAAGVVYLILDGGYIAAYYPSPGQLSPPHHQLTSVDGAINCHSCHALAGISSGCLDCHEEIAEQLAGDHGFHDYLLRENDRPCAACHREHRGPESLLVDKQSWSGLDLNDFGHPHVAFRLIGRHREIECSSCHTEKLPVRFTLPKFAAHPRQNTFLGLRQECVFCHEDIHSGGLSEDCESCHDQKAFRPAPYFDHSQHFALKGGHSRVACDGCHLIPENTAGNNTKLAPFAKVRGTRCSECHSSPHRTSFDEECESCHGESPESWSAARGSVTAELHRQTAFDLFPQHAELDCVKCHELGRSYDERFPNPALPGYLRREDTCQGCHRNAHGGQFLRKGIACLDCHERQWFKPHQFTRERHDAVYPLVDAHAKAPCERCHVKAAKTEARVFVGTSRDCKNCHENPHDGQFGTEGKGCADCHGTKHFLPARFDEIQHRVAFPLTGSHRAVPCISCHTKNPATGIRTFVGTTKECKTCHKNPHGDQFATELVAADCTVCHSRNAETFAIRPFDHEKRTGYTLTGAHANAKCIQCHVETEVHVAAASALPPPRGYRGTSTECSWCHRDAHRGQFRQSGKTDCRRCHTSTARWAVPQFNHNAQTSFPLDGAHVGVECRRCHTAVTLDDGNVLTQFKPLGKECDDCHAVDSH